MGIGVLCGLLAGALWGLVFIVPELLSTFSPLELAAIALLVCGVTWSVRAHASSPAELGHGDLAEGDGVAGAAHRHQA